MEIRNKQLGIGTISLALCLVGILFSISFRYVCIGDYLVDGIGLNSWSNGDSGIHYTIFYSLIFFIPSLLIGLKYKENYGSKIGRNLSAIIGLLILISLLGVVV
ncbi:hypothetical protein E4K67_18485 [Desulfosporosinus fructosivorans]|uniref:Uncharacterized protein n=1 Tax=Desulfosporosinus fructosivorans TaxID=2018669 RepID=A0A4Z0R3A1_9FIRM|nr:hypothetical protein [Desulfosporosinus fructosivorans]TGE37064.1 hypothetical protein E4K67_18485 [Desulfosporosinus fructosivorans]